MAMRQKRAAGYIGCWLGNLLAHMPCALVQARLTRLRHTFKAHVTMLLPAQESVQCIDSKQRQGIQRYGRYCPDGLERAPGIP